MPIVRVPQREFDVDAVVFDKDGTLIDLDASWGPIADGWVSAVAGDDGELRRRLADELGLDLTGRRLVPDSTFAAGTLGDVGAVTVERLGDAGWSAEAIAAALVRAHAAVEAATASHPAVTLADLQPLFSRLVTGGVQVAVLTSDDRAPTLRFLDEVGVRALVSVVITADDVSHPKPHPDGLHRIRASLGFDEQRIVMIGDSLADHRAARAAGVAFVAVGHRSAAAVGADASVDSVADLTVG